MNWVLPVSVSPITSMTRVSAARATAASQVGSTGSLSGTPTPALAEPGHWFSAAHAAAMRRSPSSIVSSPQA